MRILFQLTYSRCSVLPPRSFCGLVRMAVDARLESVRVGKAACHCLHLIPEDGNDGSLMLTRASRSDGPYSLTDADADALRDAEVKVDYALRESLTLECGFVLLTFQLCVGAQPDADIVRLLLRRADGDRRLAFAQIIPRLLPDVVRAVLAVYADTFPRDA